MQFIPPAEVCAVLATFTFLFSRPVWQHAQALLCGAILAPAGSTVTAALHALAKGSDGHFTNYHRVLNRACWSARKAAGTLLRLLVEAFVSAGAPLIFGIDEMIERRRGRKLSARAIYHDPTRSSAECFQKTSGLRWMSVHLLAFIPGAERVWALPFLSALCPSKRYAPFAEHGRRHKPVVERARGLIGQVCRWHPDRALIFVADGSYAALELLGWCVRVSARRTARNAAATLTLITRLRLDAALYRPVPKRVRGKRGRSRLKGRRLPPLARRLKLRSTRWQKATLPWYGAAGTERQIECATGTALWYHSGMTPVPIRWVLIRDPEGRFEAQALLSTNLQLSAEKILRAFVRRWQMEVTFEEARAHLGIDGQRQWSDTAVTRSTPARLALFSFVALIARQLPWASARQSAWYSKEHLTFSDMLAAVRRCIWKQMNFCMSAPQLDMQESTPDFPSHLIEMLCFSG